MLPHNHLIIAGIAIAPISALYFPDKSTAEIAEWVLVGGLASSVIDLDILALTLLKAKNEPRLRQFRNPLMIYRKFKLFMDMITETGVLKTGLKTHLIVSALLMLLVYYFSSAYFVPVALGVLSHMLSDLQNVRRISANAV